MKIRSCSEEIEMTNKVIKVTCAIIEDSGKILVAQRSENMSLPLKWEFPGGKIEEGEAPEDCIKREIKEELELSISVKGKLNSSVHSYGNKTIELIPFICELEDGELCPREHKDVIWGEPTKLKHIDWAEADIPIYQEYINYTEGNR